MSKRSLFVRFSDVAWWKHLDVYYKSVHIKTSMNLPEVESRNERSLIYHFLVEKSWRQEIRDVEVKRGLNRKCSLSYNSKTKIK